MIGLEILIQKINSIISSGNVTDVNLLRASGIIETLDFKNLNSVEDVSDLPPAESNKNRFFYIKKTKTYTYSDGNNWDISNLVRKKLSNLSVFGSNADGKLASTSLPGVSYPIPIETSVSSWIYVDAGSSHSLAIRSDGVAWAWGNNVHGRLGDGTNIPRSSPVSVVGGFTDWAQVSAGNVHSIGLRTNGTAWAWGSGSNGVLGDGLAIARSSPVSVVGGFTDWKQVSAGNNHNIGLRANGTAWAWGFNAQGRIGDGTILSKSSPVSVVGGFSDWTQVSAGGSHSLGIRANGTAWAWGNNFYGMLGDGTVTNKSSPVSVTGTGWTQVSAGGSHSLGIRANGTAWAWGINNFGQIGANNTTNALEPQPVFGGFTDWLFVDAGQNSSFGIRATGNGLSWGGNQEFQLADSTNINRSSPVYVSGGFSDWTSVSIGDTHGFVIRGI